MCVCVCVYLQSSLAQLGIPFTDVVKVLAAILLLGNVLFYEAKNQELSLQGADGTCIHTYVCLHQCRSVYERMQVSNQVLYSS